MKIVALLIGYLVLATLLWAGLRAVYQRTDVKNFFAFLRRGDEGDEPIGSAGRDPASLSATARRRQVRRNPSDIDPPGL